MADTLDQIIAKAIRAALDECAETNEIEIAEHHRDYLTNWATEFTRDALLAEGREGLWNNQTGDTIWVPDFPLPEPHPYDKHRRRVLVIDYPEVGVGVRQREERHTMRSHHRCDPRSDYQCARCEQDQLDHERMIENAREAENDADLHQLCEACDSTGHCCHDCDPDPERAS